MIINYSMISRRKLSIFLLILIIITTLIILAKLELFPTVFSEFQQNEREIMLRNKDILAHPERYPIDSFRKTSRNEISDTSSLLTSNDTWKKLGKRLYVYSAFQDPRSKDNSTIIRIIGMIHTQDQGNLNLRCLFKFNESSQYVAGEHSASMILHEQHNSTYLGTFFICFFKGFSIPIQVALREENTTSKPKWLDLHRTQRGASTDSIGICVRPIYGDEIDGKLLAEFLAYYYITGVKKFTFYDYQIPEKLLTYLKFLSVEDDILIAVLNWKVPDGAAKETWQYGQMISTQDCILRNAEQKYVLLVDIDEFLVPRQHFTLLEMMEDMDSKIKRQIGSFIFRQSYFCRGQDLTNPKMDFPLEISRKIMREENIWPSKKRSKIIVKPLTVIEGGIHFVWHHLKGWQMAKVPWELAMIHHYSKHACDSNLTLIEDRTAEPFKIEIMFSKPMSIWNDLNPK